MPEVDEKLLEDYKRMKEREIKQYKRQNDYIKNNFDRVSVTLPKGTKDVIMATGESVNSYINKVVAADLERLQEQNKPKKKKDDVIYVDGLPYA